MSRHKAKHERQKTVRRAFRVFCFAFCLLPFAFVGEAQADIVVFKNGRTMSVKSCVLDGEMATMKLRDGGEATFPSSLVARVDPDEVPYPEDEPAAPVEVAAAPVLAVQPALIPESVLAERPYADLITMVAAAHKIDPRLVHAVIEQESNYQARVRSKKGARGLMQLMPGTARQYGVSNSYDPKANLEAGVRHLKDLLSRLDLPLALAAYNAGEGTIKRFGGLPPYAETRNYVRNILRRVGAQPAGSGTD